MPPGLPAARPIRNLAEPRPRSAPVLRGRRPGVPGGHSCLL